MAFAFLSTTFSGAPLSRSLSPTWSHTSPRPLPTYACEPSPSRQARATPRPRIAIIANTPPVQKKEVTINVEEIRQGVFGTRLNAYWDSMGVLPLFFAGFGLVALTIKMLKLKGGQLRGGQAAVTRMTVPKSVITSEAEEAELHVFRCGGCGYEMYPARGREFKFFPDSFKCPLCGAPKSEFWDLNDPNDPRNQTDEDGDDQDDPGDDSSDPEPVAPNTGSSDQLNTSES